MRTTNKAGLACIILGSLVLLSMATYAAAEAPPVTSPSPVPKTDGLTWVWACSKGQTYTWLIEGESSDGKVKGTTATWTIESVGNTSLLVGNLTGSIESEGFKQQPAKTMLYELDFVNEKYTDDLAAANYLRTGGFLPWYNLSNTAAGAYNVWWNQSIISFVPEIKEQMIILNRTLQKFVGAGYNPGIIEFVKGRWVLSYQHATNAKQMMNWTIAQTGMLTEFLETKVDGTNQVRVRYQYPGLHYSIIIAIIVAILTVVASIGYVTYLKKKDLKKKEAR